MKTRAYIGKTLAAVVLATTAMVEIGVTTATAKPVVACEEMLARVWDTYEFAADLEEQGNAKEAAAAWRAASQMAARYEQSC